MSRRKSLVWQIALLLTVIALFVSFNVGLYSVLTRRLSNNFSGATQAKMVDVKKYLPFEEGSELAEVDASLKLIDDLPVLDGAAALVPVYAAVINAVYPPSCVTYEGGVFSDDNYYGENFAADSKMQYKNTVRGYKAIVDGETDILFCAGPSEEQKAYAKEQGVTLCYEPVGLEAFVFFVNAKNPVDGLTAAEIRGIYGGTYTNWAQLGGADRPINPVTRLAGSGSQSAMEKFMGDTPFARKTPLALFGASIGYSFRYYMSGIVGNDEVKMLSLNGVYPDAENIRSGAYPAVTQFYAIYREDNQNPNVKLLIDWLLSDEGQTLIERSGYVRIK